jgi:hypothetical protein
VRKRDGLGFREYRMGLRGVKTMAAMKASSVHAAKRCSRVASGGEILPPQRFRPDE